MKTKQEIHLDRGDVALLSSVAVIGCLFTVLFSFVMENRIEFAMHFFSVAKSGMILGDLLRMMPSEIIVPECPNPTEAKSLIFTWSCSHRPPDHIEVVFDHDIVIASSLITSDARFDETQITNYLVGVSKSWLLPLVDAVFIVCTLETIAFQFLWVSRLLIQRENRLSLLASSCIFLVVVGVMSLQSRVPVYLLEAISNSNQAFWGG